MALFAWELLLVQEALRKVGVLVPRTGPMGGWVASAFEGPYLIRHLTFQGGL